MTNILNNNRSLSASRNNSFCARPSSANINHGAQARRIAQLLLSPMGSSLPSTNDCSTCPPRRESTISETVCACFPPSALCRPLGENFYVSPHITVVYMSHFVNCSNRFSLLCSFNSFFMRFSFEFWHWDYASRYVCRFGAQNPSHKHWFLFVTSWEWRGLHDAIQTRAFSSVAQVANHFSSFRFWWCSFPHFRAHFCLSFMPWNECESDFFLAYPQPQQEYKLFKSDEHATAV